MMALTCRASISFAASRRVVPGSTTTGGRRTRAPARLLRDLGARRSIASPSPRRPRARSERVRKRRLEGRPSKGATSSAASE